MPDTVLVLNSGSSSIKFQLFEVAGADKMDRRLRGQFEGIGTKPRLVARDGRDAVLVDKTYSGQEIPDPGTAIERLDAWLRGFFAPPTVVGHRVVHGGPTYDRPVRVTEEVIGKLKRLIPLAPLHQPNNLAPIEAIHRRRPDLIQVACFDTSFHRQHGELADRFALPEHYYREGVRRYGFHGLSYEFVAEALGKVAPHIADRRIVIAHLGSGASMCGLHDRRSVDSTMGFTALDGLPMGTRPGSLDPGVVLYLQQTGMSSEAIQKMLYHDCGLKALSGISNDVRELLASSHPRARLAIDYFVYRIAKDLGALVAALGGLDGLVFTAGIGENSAAIRKAVIERTAWLGFELDEIANSDGRSPITTPASRLSAYIIPTNEELMIARHALKLARVGADSSKVA